MEIDDNGRRFTDSKPMATDPNFNGEVSIDDQKAVLNRQINPVSSINDEENKSEPMIQNQQQSELQPSWFSKHKKGLIIAGIAIIAIIAVILVAVLLTSSTKLRTVQGLILTRQFNQFDTYSYSKQSSVCVKVGNAANQNSCQKVSSNHVFTVMNVTSTQVDPQYLSLSASRLLGGEEEFQSTVNADSGSSASSSQFDSTKENFYTIALWVKEMTIDLDGNKTTIVKSDVQMEEKKSQLGEIFDRFSSQGFMMGRNSTQAQDDSSIFSSNQVKSEFSFTKDNNQTEWKNSAIVFFTVWETGKVMKIFKPEHLDNLVWEQMQSLINDFNPKLEKDLYVIQTNNEDDSRETAAAMSLEQQEKRKRLSEETRYDLAFVPEYFYKDDTQNSTKTLRKDVSKKSYSGVSLPENSILSGSQSHKFDNQLTLVDVSESSQTSFFHDQKNSGQGGDLREKNFFRNDRAEILEEKLEDLENFNWIPHSNLLSEISTKTESRAEITEKKVMNKDQVAIMMVLAIQPKYQVIIPSPPKAKEESGGTLKEKKVDAQGAVFEEQVTLKRPKYNWKLEKLMKEKFRSQKLHYMSAPPKHLGRELNEILKRHLDSSTELDDMRKTHAIIYPAFNIDVYGFKAFMNILVEITPAQDRVDTSIVIGSEGLFEFPIFTRTDEVEMGEAIDKMFDYVIKGTNVVATIVGAVDRFMGTDYLNKIKSTFVTVTDKTGSIDSQSIFVDYFAQFLTGLNDKLIKLNNDFMAYLKDNLTKFTNPLIKWKEKFYKFLKDLYDKYLKKIVDFLNGFIESRKADFKSLLDKLGETGAIVYPDMIDFMNSVKGYLKARMVDADLPGEIRVPYVKDYAEKVLLIFNETKILANSVKEKVDFFFSMIPFEELKTSIDLIHGEFTEVFSKFDSLLTDYNSIISTFAVDKFNPLKIASTEGYGFLSTQIDSLIKIMQDKEKDYPDLAAYREIYTLVKGIIMDSSALSVSKITEFVTFPAAEEIVKANISKYFTALDTEASLSVNSNIFDRIMKLVMSFKGSIMDISISYNDIVRVLDSFRSLDSMKSVIRNMSVLDVIISIYDKTESLQVMERLLTLQDSRKLVVCSEYAQSLKDVYDNYVTKGAEILTKIKDFNLQDVLKMNEWKDKAKTIIDKLNPLLEVINAFSEMYQFTKITEADILNKVDVAVISIKTFIEENYTEIKKTFDDKVAVINQKNDAFKAKVAQLFTVDCTSTSASSSSSSSASASASASSSASDTAPELSPDGTPEKKCLLYDLTQDQYKLLQPGKTTSAKCLIASNSYPLELLNLVKLNELSNNKIVDLVKFIQEKTKYIEVFFDSRLSTIEKAKVLIEKLAPDSIKDAIDKLVDFENSINKTLINDLPTAIKDKLTGLISIGADYILKACDYLLGLAESLVLKFDKLPTFAINQIKALNNYLQNSKFSALIKEDWLNNAEEKIKSICYKIVDVRVQNFYQQYDYFTKKLLTKLPKVLQPMVSDLLVALKGKMDEVYGFAKDVFKGVIDAVKKSVSDSITAFLTKFQTLVIDRLNDTYKKALAKKGEINEAEALDLNGYFSILDIAGVIEIVGSLKAVLSPNERSQFLLDIDLINSQMEQNLKRVSMRVDASELTQLEATAEIERKVKKQIDLKITNMQGDLTKFFNVQGMDPLTGYIAKFQNHSEMFTKHFAVYMDAINKDVEADLVDWKTRFSKTMDEFFKKYQSAVNSQSTKNFEDFELELYDKLGSTSNLNYKELQNTYKTSFFQFKDSIKQSYSEGLTISLDGRFTTEESTLLASIKLTTDTMKDKVTSANTGIKTSLGTAFTSAVFTDILDKQLVNIALIASDVILKRKKLIIEELTLLKGKLYDAADNNSNPSEFQSLQALVDNREVETSQQLLNILFSFETELTSILSNSHANDSSTSTSKSSLEQTIKNAVFDSNVLSDIITLQDIYIDPCFREISGMLLSMKEESTRLEKEYKYEDIAKDVYQQTLETTKTSISGMLNNDVALFIQKNVKAVYESARDLLDSQLTKVNDSITELVETKKTSSLHLLSLVTFAASKGIAPLTELLLTVFDRYADQAIEYFNADMMVQFKKQLNDNISKIQDEQLRAYIKSINDTDDYKALVQGLFDDVKAQAGIVKTSVREAISTDSQGFKVKIQALYDTLKAKVKAATEASGETSATDYIYSTIQLVLESIDKLSYFPKYEDFEDIINSSKEMQQEFFKSIVNDLVEGGLSKMLTPVDAFVKDTISTMVQRVEEKMMPFVTKYLSTPILDGKAKVKELVGQGMDFVYGKVEECTNKLLELTNLHKDKAYVAQLRLQFKSQTALVPIANGSLNINDIINTLKTMFNIVKNFKSLLQTLPELSEMYEKIKKVIEFAKTGVQVFRDSIDDKFVPLIKKITLEKLELYKNYVKEAVLSKDTLFVREYERIVAEMASLPQEFLNMAIEKAVDRVVSVAEKNQGHWAVEMGKALVNIKFYKFEKTWDWDYSYNVYFTAGPVPCVLSFSIGANVFFDFETGLKDLGLNVLTEVGGSVYVRAQGGVTAGLVELGAFIQGTIVKIKGSLGVQLSLMEFSIGSQICLTGEFGSVEAGLSIKTGIPGVKTVCNNVKEIKSVCRSILGFFGLDWCCEVVEGVKVVCEVIEYCEWKKDFLTVPIVKPYVYQTCLELSKSFKNNANQGLLELPGY